MSKNKNAQIIAPVIICILIIAGVVFQFVLPILVIGLSLMFRVISIIVTVVVIGVAIYVLRERIKEIRSGAEDDLGNY